MKQLSRKRRIKQARQAIGKNWREVMAYERFAERMSFQCRCANYRPCDGVMAGMGCDLNGWNRDDDDFTMSDEDLELEM